jgi:transposase
MVVGIDPHKNTHTAVAVSGATGAKMREITVTARRPGHERLLTWARGLDEDLVFAVEDCRHVSGGLQRFLLARGEPVVPVPPKLMAGARRGARTRGKSDPIDALAVAHAALRHPELPAAHLCGAERDVRLLVDHRDDLVRERTRVQNRLRWNLHDLDPDFAVPLRGLDRFVWLERTRAHLRELEPCAQVRIAAEQTDAIQVLTRTINALGREITTLVQLLAPELLQILGCGALTAAKVLGEAGGVRRFRSEAAFAMHAGASPLQVASGDRQRHRLNRSGNRRERGPAQDRRDAEADPSGRSSVPGAQTIRRPREPRGAEVSEAVPRSQRLQDPAHDRASEGSADDVDEHRRLGGVGLT